MNKKEGAGRISAIVIGGPANIFAGELQRRVSDIMSGGETKQSLRGARPNRPALPAESRIKTARLITLNVKEGLAGRLLEPESNFRA